MSNEKEPTTDAVTRWRAMFTPEAREERRRRSEYERQRQAISPADLP